MKISNIKISVYFEKDLAPKKKSNEKTIYTFNAWVFTIYHHTPTHVNITGLKSESEIPKVIQYLEAKYNIKCQRQEIDCIMTSHKDNIRLKMKDIPKALQPFSSIYYLCYEAELFTGCFLKSKIKSEFPTINLFHTGSFQLIGAKSFEKIDKAYAIVQYLIRQTKIP